MRSVFTWVDRHWWAPAPAERLATLRILIGGFSVAYVAIRSRHLFALADFQPHQFEPVGIVSALQEPLPGDVVRALVAATLVAGVVFVAGWRYKVTGPLYAVLLLSVISYRNSWGQIFHTENLMVLHTMVLAIAPAADVLSLDARERGPRRPALADGRYGWAVVLLCMVTVLPYVITGQTKLREAGLDWVTSDTLRNQVAYDNLRKAELGDSYSSIGATLVSHGWLFPPLAAFTLIVELGAPLALLGRRMARAWVLGAWLFHAGILALMAILFPYQLLGVAFAPFFPVERLWRVRWRHLRWRTSPQPADI